MGAIRDLSLQMVDGLLVARHRYPEQIYGVWVFALDDSVASQLNDMVNSQLSSFCSCSKPQYIVFNALGAERNPRDSATKFSESGHSW